MGAVVAGQSRIWGVINIRYISLLVKATHLIICVLCIWLLELLLFLAYRTFMKFLLNLAQLALAIIVLSCDAIDRRII